MKEIKKQNSIDFLIENYFGTIEGCTPRFKSKINEAKKMHKKEIIDAVNFVLSNNKSLEDLEEYYNKTFKTLQKCQ